MISVLKTQLWLRGQSTTTLSCIMSVEIYQSRHHLNLVLHASKNCFKSSHASLFWSGVDKPEVVHEMEWDKLDIVGLTSTHSTGFGLKLLQKGWILSFSGVA